MSWIAAGCAVVASTAVAATYVAPYAIKWKQRRRLRALCRQSRGLVLTYDDGPCSRTTPLLLDVLASEGAPATFFLRGDHAAEQPGLVDRIVGAGHEVGCHSARHYHPWTTLPWKLSEDMAEGYRLLARWMPDQRAYYRPPFGKPFLPVFLRLADRGLQLAWWTVDSGDTKASYPAIDRTLEAVRMAGGGVVLMHDYRRRREDHREYVLELTRRLVRLARSEGFALKRMRDLYQPGAVLPLPSARAGDGAARPG